MKVKLSKWGNSLAIRIPASIIQEAALREGNSLAIEAVGGWLRLTPLEAGPNVDELANQITEDNVHGEKEWGAPVGNETW